MFFKVVDEEEEMVVVVQVGDILADAKDQGTMNGLAAWAWAQVQNEGHELC